VTVKPGAAAIAVAGRASAAAAAVVQSKKRRMSVLLDAEILRIIRRAVPFPDGMFRRYGRKLQLCILPAAGRRRAANSTDK
jgi:hypothetical protein